MLTAKEKLTYAKQVGFPKNGWLLYEHKGKVFHAKRTDKPYEHQRYEVEFNAPSWLPQNIVDEYIKKVVAQ